MALKVLMLRSRLTPLLAELQAFEATRAGFAAREAELERDIADAQTDEERSVVSAAVDAFEQERSTNAAEIARVQQAIDAINDEIRSLEAAQTPPPASQPNNDPGATNHKRSVQPMPIIDTERRWFGLSYQQRDALLAQDSTKEFLQRFRQLRAQQNSATGAELGIPTEFMQILRDLTYQNSKLWPYIHSESIRGNARQNIVGTGAEAVWSEMLANINEITLDFTQLEMDGYMLAGYMAIPNDIIEDSLINLAVYVETKLAKAIAKSRDKAILKGTGSTGKQLVGIIPSLKSANSVTVTGFNLGEILSKISLVDDGEEAYGEIIAVMKRSTFYGRFLRNMITTDSAGRYVVPDLKNPNIGVRVVFSQYMDADKVLFGDFSRYMVTKRAALKLAASTDVKFIEDQTVIKGIERLDGKPLHVDGTNKTKDWVLVTIKDAEGAAG